VTDCRREGWAFDEGDLRRKRRALSKLRSAVWQTVLGMGCVLWSLPAAAQEGVDFNRDVRPLLAKACCVCHGNDPEHRQADLRLDSSEQATRDLGGHRAIVPGNAAESELFRRASSDDEDLRMPPADAGERLT